MRIASRHANAPPTTANFVARELQRAALLVLAAGMLVLLPVPGAAAQEMLQEQPQREHLIKAAILFKVAQSTSWPEAAFGNGNEPLRICVLGGNRFGSALAALDGRDIGGRQVVSLAVSDVDAVAGCHVLWIGETETARLVEIFGAVAGRPVLTVAAIDRFASRGGIVGLAEEAGRGRLEANLRAAREAGLVLGSKLLRFADTVDGETASVVPGVVNRSSSMVSTPLGK